jgi:DNA polymerase I-like protein with 3'-5' exonuclease and polymerase domains
MGAKIMDTAGIIMQAWIDEYNIPANRVVYYHDEYIWECYPEDSEQVAALGVKSVIAAGEQLGLNVPLNAEAKIGKNWSEVH